MPIPNRLEAVTELDPALGAAREGESPDRDVLAELRRDLSVIVAELTKVVEERSAQAKLAADQGLVAARGTIRTHPIASITVAALLGAGVAIAFASVPRSPRTASRLADWAPPTLRAELMRLAEGMQKSASQSSTLSSLASAFERVVENVSAFDSKTSLAPALEKAGTWLSSMRASMGGK